MNFILDWILMFVFLAALCIAAVVMRRRGSNGPLAAYSEGEVILVYDGGHWERRIYVGQINDGRIICVSIDHEDKFLANLPFEMKVWSKHQKLRPDQAPHLSIQTDESVKFMNL